MRRPVSVASVLTLTLFGLAGCQGMQNVMNPTQVTSTTPQTVAQVQAEPYDGPKVRIAVMEFDNKTGINVKSEYKTSGSGLDHTVSDPIGDGMKEQLVTAMAQTGAFILLERQAIQDVLKEQELGASGRVKKPTAARIGEVEGAQFLIYGAVTEYQASQASLGGDLATGVTGGPLWWAASKVASAAVSQDHVAIDIRIVDAQTGRIVNATSVEGKPREVEGAFAGIFGTTLAGVSGSYKTPIQKAVRACMIKAVNWIAENSLPPGSIKTQGSSATPTVTHSVAPTAPVPAPVAPSPSSDGMVTVTGSRVNVRRQPTTQSPVVTSVSHGAVFKKLGEQGNWVNVELSDQTTGWIHKSLVK